mmetsp:Transcript_41684/g.105097  ORF Transcript_41684/g.105097 Transcript_41684/m.105097 type:complete len:107 (-) Transcript_41684:60-380(-)
MHHLEHFQRRHRKGSITLLARNSAGECIELILNNVYYVPSSPCNILGTAGLPVKSVIDNNHSTLQFGIDTFNLLNIEGFFFLQAYPCPPVESSPHTPCILALSPPS